MRQPATLLIFAILALPLCAVASDNSCANIPELKQFALDECVCGKALSKLPIAAPQGMSLIAACGYKKEDYIGIVGEFYFKGMATVRGEIKRLTDSASEPSVLFEAKSSDKHSDFRNATSSLKFEKDTTATEKLKLPQPIEESPCWAAPATINVKLLYIKSGNGLDDEGNFPKEFDVVKVGPTRKCKNEESSAE